VIAHCGWAFIPFHTEFPRICKAEGYCGDLPPPTHHPCAPKSVSSLPCGAFTDQTCFWVALDVVGFSQFKHHYETQMEERATEQLGRITKEEFLTAIVVPYRMEFTPENIKKSYETTGTWPVNRSKITADKIAPAEGLSHYSGPIVAPSSPVKAFKTLIYNILSEETPANGNTATKNNSPTPAPADSNLPHLSSSSTFINDLSKTCAAFLLKSTHPLSPQALEYGASQAPLSIVDLPP